MKIIRDVNEEEVFLEFYESDCHGKSANRDYTKFIDVRKPLFDRLPSKREWKEVSLEEGDYSKLRVMTGSPPWCSIQSGTLNEALKTLMECQEQEWEYPRDKVNKMCQGGNINQRGILLITDTHAALPFTIIEGHHQILALFRQNKKIERCYAGFCEGDSIWMRKE